jgi:Ca2+-binding EF-hand superfamily protein
MFQQRRQAAQINRQQTQKILVVQDRDKPIREMFAALDTDKNNFLSIDEVKVALDDWGIALDIERTGHFVKSFSKTGKSVLNFDEFKSSVEFVLQLKTSFNSHDVNQDETIDRHVRS